MPAGPDGRRIVVVDDEPEPRRALLDYLAGHGFLVRGAGSGAELDAALAEDGADLLVLDGNMSGEDGIAIARRLRAAGAMPILLLTAPGEPVDRIVGLEVGADDCVTKPFEPREVLARIRALLRRHEPAPAAVPACVRFGRVMLDLDGRCLVQEDGTHLELTSMEYDLLQVFARNPNRVLTRARLLDLAHHRGPDPFDRSVDVRIARLRRKVEDDPARPRVIRTMRGDGYMFVPAVP